MEKPETLACSVKVEAHNVSVKISGSTPLMTPVKKGAHAELQPDVVMDLNGSLVVPNAFL